MAPPLSSAFLCPLTGMFFRHIFSSQATSSVVPGRPLQDTPTPFPYPVGLPCMVHRLCAFVCSSVPCELREGQAPFHMSLTLGLLRRRRSPFMSRHTKGMFIFSCCVWNGLKQHRFIFMHSSADRDSRRAQLGPCSGLHRAESRVLCRFLRAGSLGPPFLLYVGGAHSALRGSPVPLPCDPSIFRVARGTSSPSPPGPHSNTLYFKRLT